MATQDSASVDAMIRRDIASDDYHEALEKMVRAYQHVIVRFCMNMLRDPSQAEDLAQEVFLAALGALPRYREEASVRTWLIGIARKQCLKSLRKHSRREHLEKEKRDEITENVHPGPPLLSEETGEERAHLVSIGLEQVDSSERALLVMRYNTGLPIAEVAHILGISVSTVRRRLALALRHLKEIVENETR